MLFEVIELDEVATTVVYRDALEEFLPHLVLIIKDLLGTNDSLHSWVLQNKVLNLHVFVNEFFELLIIDLAAAILIYLLVSVLDEFCDFALSWCWEPG